MKIRAFSNPCSIWRNKKKKNYEITLRIINVSRVICMRCRTSNVRLHVFHLRTTQIRRTAIEMTNSVPQRFRYVFFNEYWLQIDSFFSSSSSSLSACVFFSLPHPLVWGSQSKHTPTIAVWLFMSYSIRNCFTFTFDFFPHHIRGRNSMPWITNCLLILVFSLLKCHRVVSNFNNCTCRQRVTRATYTQLPHLHPWFSFLLFAL